MTGGKCPLSYIAELGPHLSVNINQPNNGLCTIVMDNNGKLLATVQADPAHGTGPGLSTQYCKALSPWAGKRVALRPLPSDHCGSAYRFKSGLPFEHFGTDQAIIEAPPYAQVTWRAQRPQRLSATIRMMLLKM